MDRKEIARNIKRMRENSGYTQQQVADVLNVDRSTYAYYELGKILPSIETIYALSRVFNVHYSELLGGERKDRKKLMDSGGRDYQKAAPINVYELNKDEKTLIMHFRMLSQEAKDDVLQQIGENVSERYGRRKGTTEE
ncbi:MAG TPA: transcriptional regulator [Clostridiales bacterium]|nr:transcriptional regulator [Clostridiales bacterium]